MGLFHFFKIVQMVPNGAEHLIYFKHEYPFKEEMMMNKELIFPPPKI